MDQIEDAELVDGFDKWVCSPRYTTRLLRLPRHAQTLVPTWTCGHSRSTRATHQLKWRPRRYDDYLDSFVTDTDVFYLGGVETASRVVELG